MTRDEFEALIEGSTEPGEDLDLVVALSRLGRARRPALELVSELATLEEDLEDPGADEDVWRLAAADRPRRPLPVRYEGGGCAVELRAGLGGLPALLLVVGPPGLEVELEGERALLELEQPVLVPWVDEAPDELLAHASGQRFTLRPV